MKDIGKINSNQIFGLWKNLTICLIAIVALIVISKILPYYLSPVIALAIAFGMYVYIYNERFSSIKIMDIPILIKNT